MKRSDFLFAAILLALPAAASAEVNHLAGRWNCWHEQIEGTQYEETGFLADARPMQDGRYLFTEAGDEDGEQRGAFVYATFDGENVHIDIPDSPFMETVEATLSIDQQAGRTRFYVSGVVNVETRNTISEEFPAANGGTIIIPRVVTDTMPVSFHCSKSFNNRNVSTD